MDKITKNLTGQNRLVSSSSIVVIVFNATFVPFCKQLIEECDTIKQFYRTAMSSKRTETLAATDFATKSIHEWTKRLSIIAWLARGLPD